MEVGKIGDCQNKTESEGEHESERECESALLTELFINLLTCCRFVMFWEERRKCAFSGPLHKYVPCLPAKIAKLLLSQRGLFF